MPRDIKGYIERSHKDTGACCMCKKNFSGWWYKKYHHKSIRHLFEDNTPLIICKKCAVREGGKKVMAVFLGRWKTVQNIE
jgi:hypothetical protein